MAVVDSYSAEYTDKYIDVPPSLIKANKEAKVKGMFAYVVPGASDAGATLYMLRPPAGSRWNGKGWIWSTALGTGATVAVGTGITGSAVAADTDKFLAATSHASATKTDLGPVAIITADLAAAVVGELYEFDGETDVIITTAGHALAGTEKVALYFEVTLP